MPLFTASSGWETPHTGTFAAGEEVLWRVTFDNLLGPGPLHGLAVGDARRRRDRSPCASAWSSVVVTRSAPTGALVDIPFDQDVERIGPGRRRRRRSSDEHDRPARARRSPATGRAPITGPTALGSDRRRFWRLAWTLAVTDFKLRFFGSVLGYLWQLMRPLMLFGVIYIVFAEILKVGGDQPFFGVALLLGIVLFQFFTDATAASVQSLVTAREPRAQDRLPAHGRARCPASSRRC